MTKTSRAETPDRLPAATTDLQQAKSDLDQFGYCILSNLLTIQQVKKLQECVPRQAKAEEERGLHDQAQGASTSQYVYMLVNKGDIFLDLVQHPVILEMIEHVLGPEFLLSASDAIIAKPGGGLMPLHTDQWWMPPPAAEGAAQVRVGAIKRFNRGSTRTEPGKSISAAACANVMWMVSDFTEENGGTRLVPRSHLYGEQPDPSVPHKVKSIAGMGPAGTALVFDGRLWHATGSNVTRDARLGVITAYCGPQYRPMENYTLGARDDIVKSASPRLLSLLGFKIWDGYGKLDDPNEKFIARGRTPVGEL